MKGRIWAPLLLLGLLGMFMSEVSVWNLQPLIAGFAQAPLKAPLNVLITHAVYLSLFLLAAHLIQRWRVDDAVSLLLMGSVYGLVNEGLFADKILASPMGGPRLFGLPLLAFSFTGLSAHPVVDFLGCFLLYRAALSGRLSLGEDSLSWKEARAWALICLCWGALAFAAWHLAAIGGIPLGWQAFAAAYVFVWLFVFGRWTSASEVQALPEPLLGRLGLGVCLAPTVLAALLWLLRLASQGRLASFLFFCVVLAAYSGLTVLWIRSRPQVPDKSILDQCFPVRGRLSLKKCLKLAAMAACAFLLVRLAALLPAGRALSVLAGFLLVLSGVVFAAAFPLIVLWRLAGRRGFIKPPTFC